MRPLRTERLVLRNWQDRDRDLFHRLNSDERIMEFFPFRRSRAESDAFMDQLCAENAEKGYGWAAAEIAATGKCIGFVGIHDAEIVPVVPVGSMEIGWRLLPEFWGHGYVNEAACALLDLAFGPLGRQEIVSFAVLANTRSTAVMERLGMKRRQDFSHPRVPPTHPQLKRHALYTLAAADWRSNR